MPRDALTRRQLLAQAAADVAAQPAALVEGCSLQGGVQQLQTHRPPLAGVVGTDEFKGEVGETCLLRFAANGKVKASRLLLVGAGERGGQGDPPGAGVLDPVGGAPPVRPQRVAGGRQILQRVDAGVGGLVEQRLVGSNRHRQRPAAVPVHRDVDRQVDPAAGQPQRRYVSRTRTLEALPPIRRDLIRGLGLFDAELDCGTVARTGGDAYALYRLLADGYQVVYNPAALAWHRHRREGRRLERAESRRRRIERDAVRRHERRPAR